MTAPMGLRILLVAPYSHGALGRSLADALRRAGHQVAIYDNRRNLLNPWKETAHGMGRSSAYVNRLLINWRLVRTAARWRPDLVFVVKGENIFPRTLEQIKKKTSALLFNWYPDSPFAFWNGNSTAYILYSLPLYDCFFIWRRSLISAIQTGGARRVEYLPFAFDRYLFEDGPELDEEERRVYVSDLVFAGTWDPERERWLEPLAAMNLAIWGNQWENVRGNSPLKPRVRGKAIYGRDLMKALRHSKIILNFLREQCRGSYNLRNIEVPGAGLFMLSERGADLIEEFFQEDESVACFETIEELTQKIALYLPDEERRQAIANAGHQIVHERDLYQNRVDQIIRLYWELRDESARPETGPAVRPSPAQEGQAVPVVSIVIPTYNEKEDIRLTLDSVVALQYPKKEVIIIDDASTDSTAALAELYVEQHGYRLIRLPQNGGVATARNIGMREATGEILVILNADTLLPTDFLNRILPHYEAGADFLLVQEEVANPKSLFPRYIEAESHFLYDGQSWIVWTEGFSCRRESALAVGLFPEYIPGASGEDAIFGEALEKRFRKVIDRSIRVRHIAPERLREYWRQRVGRGRGIAFRMHYEQKLSEKMIAYYWVRLVVLETLRHLLVYPVLRYGFCTSRRSPRRWRDWLPFIWAHTLDRWGKIIGMAQGFQHVRRVDP